VKLILPQFLPRFFCLIVFFSLCGCAHTDGLVDTKRQEAYANLSASEVLASHNSWGETVLAIETAAAGKPQAAEVAALIQEATEARALAYQAFRMEDYATSNRAAEAVKGYLLSAWELSRLSE